MALQVLLRVGAVGVVLGLLMAGETIRLTPDLLGDPVSTALFASLCVVFSVGLVAAGAAVLGILGWILRPFGLGPATLLAPRVLWTLALALALHTLVNEAARGSEWVESWKGALRIAIAVGGIALLASSLTGRAGTRSRRPPFGVRMLEGALAAELALALVGSAFYFALGVPATPYTGDIVARAPRFEPEASAPTVPRTGKSTGSGPRVVVLGIDGASWDRVQAGIERGDLPTFERLVARGRSAALATVHPTYSPPIWTSIVTGVPAEVHGIESFYLLQLPRLGIADLRLRNGFDLMEEFLSTLGELRRVPVTSSLRRRKAVWNLADEAGLSAGVLGLWATWPPEPLTNGFVVSDHASLARRYEWLSRRKTDTLTSGVTTWPVELEARLADLQRAPRSVTRGELAQFLPVDDGVWAEFERAERFSKGEPLSVFRSGPLNDAFYLAAARRLWREDRPDLLLVYARAVDELSHFFYEAGVPEAAALGWTAPEIARYAGVVDRAYAWTDRQIAPLVAAVDAANALLIVVSDHGWEREPDGGYNHNYAPPGILILYGAGVRRGLPALEGAGIYDVTPTVLERLGLPTARDLPGRALLEAFEAPREITWVDTYAPRSEAARATPSPIDRELEQHLRALGYLD